MAGHADLAAPTGEKHLLPLIGPDLTCPKLCTDCSDGGGGWARTSRCHRDHWWVHQY